MLREARHVTYFNHTLPLTFVSGDTLATKLPHESAVLSLVFHQKPLMNKKKRGLGGDRDFTFQPHCLPQSAVSILEGEDYDALPW